LHTDEKDPVERLRKISREMAGVKERSRAMPASLMGKLDFGLIADRDTMPDISHFGQLMHGALETLHSRATKAA